ncbi:hypothetical protein RW1_098_00010 [Rhodococcus wratislaviensis NBRC 100605]|uniref:Uncharacterized protein n=1 Tax=Rhodococcus wratislaviensis NBRC 100605 TaxID=1219028 RepID=X0Q500_RHOWR|nr:hypothetical protein RW1_098_00010 [Rhodococcus wratislaviensis NBRC 100605]
MSEYDGKQFVGIDLHRQRSVIVRQTDTGEQLAVVRIVNDPVALGLQIEKAGPNPEVVLEATYGWYWAVDVLEAAGATVHLAHPLGVFQCRREVLAQHRTQLVGDLLPIPCRVLAGAGEDGDRLHELGVRGQPPMRGGVSAGTTPHRLARDE